METEGKAHPGERRGLMLILSSPSGAGKTTLTRMLLQKQELDLTLSISLTTRKRRSSEADGIHYHFIDHAEFARRRDAGELLEHAEVHGNFYGTPREKVEDDPGAGAGRAVRYRLSGRAAGARENAPRRGHDLRAAALDARIARAAGTPRRGQPAKRSRIGSTTPGTKSSRWSDYDYVLINDDIQKTFDDLLAIVRAERLRRPRVTAGVEDFVAGLLREQV